MKNLSDSDISRVIEMAWEDRTPFDAIEGPYSTPATASRQFYLALEQNP